MFWVLYFFFYKIKIDEVVVFLNETYLVGIYIYFQFNEVILGMDLY